jgi:hypothetical protein
MFAHNSYSFFFGKNVFCDQCKKNWCSKSSFDNENFVSCLGDNSILVMKLFIHVTEKKMSTTFRM